MTPVMLITCSDSLQCLAEAGSFWYFTGYEYDHRSAYHYIIVSYWKEIRNQSDIPAVICFCPEVIELEVQVEVSKYEPDFMFCFQFKFNLCRLVRSAES